MIYAPSTFSDLKLAVLAEDKAIGRCLRLYGEFARPESDLLINIAQTMPAGVFLDVGANIGCVGLRLAKALPDWQIQCFEPQLAVYTALCANIVINKLDNVRAFPWIVGNAAELVSFPQPTADQSVNFGAVGAGSAFQNKLPAVSMRLDDLNLENVRIIKVDVEGFELQVLQGAQHLTESSSPVWLVEGKAGKKTRRVMEWLIARDYDLFWFFAPFATPQSGAPKEDTGVGDVNVVAVAKGQAPPDLPKVKSIDEDWKTRTAEFTFLNRYGYNF